MSFLNYKSWTVAALSILILWVLASLSLVACGPNLTPEFVPPAPEFIETQTTGEISSPTPSKIPENSPVPTATVKASETPTPAEAEQNTEKPQILRLAVIGDYGLSGEPLKQVATLINTWQPDYILTTGDNNYPDGEAETIDENIGQYFADYIGNYQGSYGPGADKNRFFPALGNHDLNTLQGQPYLDYFTLPGNERYYDVIFGPVHVFVLNGDSREPDGINLSSLQAEWLKEQLAVSVSPWKLVLVHQSPYSSGVHGSTDYIQWPFADWGASALISSHDHTYERLIVDGIPYFVNGLGGGPRYEFVDPLPESQFRYRANYGAMLIEAEAARIIFRFVNVAGEEIDRYSLGLPLVSSSGTPDTPEQPDTIENAQTLPNPDSFEWQLYTSGLTRPVGLIPIKDGSGRLFVLEQAGLIRIVQDGQLLPEPFLDLRDQVGSQANEQGLLGLAFHPDYLENGLFFLNYTDLEGNTVIARFQVNDPVNFPNTANKDNEQRLLYILQPYGNHNGGHIQFGPDGYLYIGMGDGGSAGDPQGNAQNNFSLLGKLLRIDVDSGQPYSIPSDNPYAEGDNGLPEIFIEGLRNPWKFSFDSATQDLYIADVGQNQWEEINYLSTGTQNGVNLGWDFREGPTAYEGTPPDDLIMVDPVAWYDHSQGCSVTGGEVYRGDQLP